MNPLKINSSTTGAITPKYSTKMILDVNSSLVFATSVAGMPISKSNFSSPVKINFEIKRIPNKLADSIANDCIVIFLGATCS